MSIPGAVAQDVPRAKGANFANNQKVVTAPAQPPVVASGIFRKILFFAVLFTFIGVLLVKKFAPDALNQWLNPWALAPATERRFSEKVRAEEKAFSEFLATFRVGPATSSHTGLAGKNRSDQGILCAGGKTSRRAAKTSSRHRPGVSAAGQAKNNREPAFRDEFTERRGGSSRSASCVAGGFRFGGIAPTARRENGKRHAFHFASRRWRRGFTGRLVRAGIKTGIY